MKLFTAAGAFRSSLIVPVLAIAVSMRTIEGADFAGPDVAVVCPIADYNAAPCTADALSGDLQACASDIACLATNGQPTLNDTFAVVPLKCACLQASNCSDTCVSEVLGFVLPPVGTYDPAFQGPGYADCPTLTFVTSPCELVQTGSCTAAEASSAKCSPDNVPNLTQSITSIRLPVPCDCFAYAGCESVCTFKSFDTLNGTQVGNNLSVSGKGTLTCPLADFGQDITTQNCFPTPIAGCNTTDDCTVDVTQLGQLIDPTFQNISFPFPCDCLQATNCPDSCTFQKGVVTTSGNSSALQDFRGIGIVSCPIAAFALQACEASFVLDRNTCVTTCPQLDAWEAATSIASSAMNGTVEILLPCECLQATMCSPECTFMAKQSGDITFPSVSPVASDTGTTPAPSPGAVPSGGSPTATAPVAMPANASSPTAPSAGGGSAPTPRASPVASAPTAGVASKTSSVGSMAVSASLFLMTLLHAMVV
jgi:hypothetical protein